MTKSHIFAPAERAFCREHFPHATARDWNDWRWQLRHRLRTPDAVAQCLPLSRKEQMALAKPEMWRMPLAITPYVMSLLALAPPDSPLRRTYLPDTREGCVSPGDFRDPLGEEAHEVANGLIQSYPHKVLLLATRDCACFCRFCTRARTTGTTKCYNSRADPFWWLERRVEIRDVLVSGGDPLTLGDAEVERILRKLRAIPHLQLIRIGTKAPASLPQRITPALVKILKRYPPLWLSLHFTHPAELTPRAATACARLRDAGLPLMNQTVLLRGINDDLDTLRELNEGLLRMGVKPYYLHQGDMAAGTAHLRSTPTKGRAILRAMAGTVSGYAIPLFMRDPPGGGAKTQLPV